MGASASLNSVRPQGPVVDQGVRDHGGDLKNETSWEASVVEELRQELGMSQQFASDLLSSYRNIARVSMDERDDEAPSPTKLGRSNSGIEVQPTVTTTSGGSFSSAGESHESPGGGQSTRDEVEGPVERSHGEQAGGNDIVEDHPTTPRNRLSLVRRVIIDDILKAAKITDGEALFAKRLFNFVDVDGSESLDFREFVVALYGFLALDSNQDRHVFLTYVFKVYDQDASDSIDSSEIRTMISDMVGFDTREFLNNGISGGMNQSTRRVGCLGKTCKGGSATEIERVWAAQANTVNEVMRKIKTELYPAGKLSISCDDFVQFFSEQKNMSQLRPILELQRALRAEYLGNKQWRSATDTRRNRRQREMDLTEEDAKCSSEDAQLCFVGQDVSVPRRRFSRSEDYLESQTTFYLAQQRGEPVNKSRDSMGPLLIQATSSRPLAPRGSLGRRSRTTAGPSKENPPVDPVESNPTTTGQNTQSVARNMKDQDVNGGEVRPAEETRVRVES